MRLARLFCVSSSPWLRKSTVGLVVAALAVEAKGQAPAPRRVPAPTPAAAADLPNASTPAKWTKTVDLANRYRFVERYPREDGRELPGALAAYRVGLVEVVKDVIDQPRGAPRRSETTRQSVFVERTTEQAGVGGVLGSVRFFERYDARPEDPAKTMGPAPLTGSTLGLRFRSTEWPLVIPLAERKPTDYEFEVVTRQMIVAQLSLIFPGQAIRIGDAWQIPRRGAIALLGDPATQGNALTGKFTELRQEVDGPRMLAVFGITGRATTTAGETAVNAEVQFTFQPTAPEKSPLDNPAGLTSIPRPIEGQIEARGGITEVRMGRTSVGSLAESGRLRFQSTREVTMQRQFDGANLGASLPKLPPAPKVEDPTAWLTWVDPSRRFELDHPQDLLPLERPALVPLMPGSAVLARSRREGKDLIQVDFVDKSITIDHLKAKLAAKYAQGKLEVLQGEEGWLPEGEWRIGKVYRIEAAVQDPSQGDLPSTRSSRIHFDGYLIQPARAVGILAIATTSREPIAPFRREVEQILKTIRIDPATPGVSK